MEYIEVAIRDEFIRLGQAMKLAGILSLGSDIKYEIVDGKVKDKRPGGGAQRPQAPQRRRIYLSGTGL